MKAVAFFNNKGGVGKTSLIYHLSHMYAELGLKVLAVDLDPQSNLTAMCLSDDAIEDLYVVNSSETIFTAINPVKRGIGEVKYGSPLQVTTNFWIVAGDLLLSDFEDDLSANWSKCLDRDERGFRVTTSLYRAIEIAAASICADIVLIDVGPTFGALNRAALICSDFVVIPVAPDLFSVRGLENVGRRLKSWRLEWEDRVSRAPPVDFNLPKGGMRPIGYVVSRHTQFADGVVRAFQRWIAKIPASYRQSVDDPSVADHELQLGTLKDYRSLIAMAQESRKPMFKLKPADGAIGGHQSAVRGAHDDFEALARRIAGKMCVSV
ncbi:ParA family protein [Cereibacter sphaeroides]|uniref:ParA family protein n=1 Tax=Cereibacter sphaeroides TaxID=1063 RepID=UPI000E5A3B83|nr:ParA family protein [Cereibacter sphaeroides]RHZ95626.1 ParA family protein [Cereibacter sphaeroides]